MDYLAREVLNSTAHDTSGHSSFSPLSSPYRQRTRSAPLSRDSRLCAPTVATVMRSLDTAQQSPVIKRLHREIEAQIKACPARRTELVNSLNELTKPTKSTGKKRTKKQKRKKVRKLRSTSA